MPPYKHIKGTIHEKHRNNEELKFSWKIPRIFSKTKVGYQIASAPLRWLETSWRLVIYPNGIEGLEPGWVDLSLTSSCVPMNSVRVTFGFLKSGKTEYFVLHDQKYGTQNQRYHNIRFMKKDDLVKRRGSLPYTTMNIICIIRVENSSVVEANAIPSTNLGVTGHIDLPVRQPNDQLTVEWKILRPFTLGSQPGDYYSSPEFVFLNTKWRLRVYPFGHPIKEYEDWIGVDVWKLDLSSCKRPVLLTVSIKQASAKEGTIYKNETLVNYRRLWTGYQLAKRSKLKDKLFYDEALTIVCTLRADEVPSTSAAACMIHGPCGELNVNSPCMIDGVCSKVFPKTFQAQTEDNVGGYPLYRRNDGNFIHIKDNMDNRWVVPYNPYLLKKYNAHINVEVYSSIKSAKYLFKYVYKGHDAVRVVLEESVDTTLMWNEIKCFLNARYVSATEAVWRLFEKKMHSKSHAIIRLPVHLENLQTVYFAESEERNALENAATRNTMLTGWFQRNRTDPEANSYLYAEISKHFTWKNYN